MNEGIKEVNVSCNNAGKRIDTYLKQELFHKYSRNYIQTAIKQEKITVNGVPVSANYRIKEADTINIDVPEKKKYKAEPEDIPVNIIHEDADILIVNKPPGMVVHPAYGNYTGTLVNALLYLYPDLPEPVKKSKKNPLDHSRLGIVHRLDKDTSGIMVIARTPQSMTYIAKQFADRTIQKTYMAIVEGKIKKKGSIVAPVGRSIFDRKKMAVNAITGKHAETNYRVIKTLGECSVVEAFPKTGRMHQIRIHMKYIDCPVVGDKSYWSGNIGFIVPRQMLHAYKITFRHPRTEEEVTYTAPLPDDFNEVIKKLKK